MSFYDKFRETSQKLEDFSDDSMLGGLVVILGAAILGMAIIIGIIGGVYWVFSDKTDHGQCLTYHQQQSILYIKSGSVMVPVTQHVNVCDQWEYPEGR